MTYTLKSPGVSAAEARDRLNATSPSFCLAKWLQTTLILQNGQTHSCHHTPMHPVDPFLLQEDPSGLHNTPEKADDREKMLQGERPAGCDYCWRIEDLPGDHLSDRHYKSSKTWAWPNLSDVLKHGADDPINPSYLEVSFSNVCNFKCAYCSPDISSKWMEEIKQYGGYPVSRSTRGIDMMERSERMPIPHREHNPYVEAFWKWWPSLYPSLHTFRITGGEPLMDKNTWKVFDRILENPRGDLTLGVNTNMNVTPQLQQRLIDYAQRLEKEVREFQVFTSAEATGRQAEYIRHGMDYAEYMRNTMTLLDNTETTAVTVMVAFNVMSVTTFVDFLDDYLILRSKYGKRIRLSINYVRYPPYLDARILTPDLKRHYADAIFNKVTANQGLDQFEVDTGKRLVDDLMEERDSRQQDMRDFGRFILEHDRRRDTSFLDVFPELEDFLNDCLNTHFS